MRTIVLTGFMGTGKTAVGREIARRLGRPFVDTDDLVEEAEGKSVAEIFAQSGEARFRAAERAAIERACAVPGVVLATGGGAMLDPENRRRLRAAGTVVCLTADVDTLLERVGADASRPLLADDSGESVRVRVSRLLGARASVYAEAHCHVDTTGRSVAAVADAVLEAIRGADLG